MRIRSGFRGVPASLAMLAAIGLAGCGSVPVSPPVADAGVSAVGQARPAGRPAPSLPPARSGRGGYYLDDGPGDRPPEGLMDIPDAEPKVEPYGRATARPYTVMGKSFTPITDERPFRQRGRGSWYGKKFHGQKTASGELYDMYKMTAAHPTLPIPSYARVTNVGNGRQVIVRVNDRGPFLHGRVIDLSYTAALKLGYLSSGSTELEVERLLPEEIARLARERREAAESRGPSMLLQSSSASQSAPLAQQATASGRPVEGGVVETGAVEARSVETRVIENRLPDSLIVETAYSPPAAAPSVPSSPQGSVAGAYYLQLGAYGQAVNAEAARVRLAQSWTGKLPPLEVVNTGPFHRVFSGPFTSRVDADSAAQLLESAGTARPVIVQR